MATLREIGPEGCLAAFRRYRDGAGPLAAYVSPTMHASLAMQVRMGFDMALPEPDQMTSWAENAPTAAPHQLLVLEGPAAAALKTALDLAAARGLWPILTSRLRFHPCGCFGDADTAALLLLRTPQVTERMGWCLVVDAHRVPSGPLPPDVYDNRHPFHPGDLPTAEDLRTLGISEVIHTALPGEGAPGPVAEDLNRWFADLTRERIAVRFHDVRREHTAT